MRNDFVTDFWRNAYETAPAFVRAQHRGQFVAAERWELAIGALIEAWSRLKSAIASSPMLAEKPAK